LKTEAGVAATFRWTGQGRQALEKGEFAYFSAEVAWSMTDRVTGDTVTNQVVGGALTNYPYFGDAAALYTVTTRRGPYGAPRFFAIPHNFEGGQYMPPVNDAQNSGEGEREAGLDQATAGAIQQLLSVFTRNRDAGQQPAPVNAEAESLREQLAALSAEMQQFSTQLTEVTGERDTYQQRVADLEVNLTQERDARAQERFSTLAATFSHLPVQTADLADHLLWLSEADPEGEHSQFFTDLLRRADEQFASAFRERGPAHGASADVMSRINAAVGAYQEEHPGVNYENALAGVFAQQPDLYRLYELERAGGDQ